MRKRIAKSLLLLAFLAPSLQSCGKDPSRYYDFSAGEYEFVDFQGDGDGELPYPMYFNLLSGFSVTAIPDRNSNIDQLPWDHPDPWDYVDYKTFEKGSWPCFIREYSDNGEESGPFLGRLTWHNCDLTGQLPPERMSWFYGITELWKERGEGMPYSYYVAISVDDIDLETGARTLRFEFTLRYSETDSSSHFDIWFEKVI